MASIDERLVEFLCDLMRNDQTLTDYVWGVTARIRPDQTIFAAISISTTHLDDQPHYRAIGSMEIDPVHKKVILNKPTIEFVGPADIQPDMDFAKFLDQALTDKLNRGKEFVLAVWGREEAK